VTNQPRRNTIDPLQLRNGMPVFGGEGRQIGTIERVEVDSITVKGQRYELTSVERLEGNKVYLTRQVGASTARAGARAQNTVQEAEGTIRVPLREERLEVEKRQTDQGEVQIRKTVTSEQQSVPVELMREEVHVEWRDVADRPATEGDLKGAFREGTIRVPVLGEEAVARKETVVTGEVVIDKTRTTETEQVTGIVRREHVDVDEHYDRARAAYQQDLTERGRGSKLEEVEPHFRTGYGTAIDQRHAGKSFEEVEPELRQTSGASGDAWEQIKQEVREGFIRARER
jgi:uncharacterized protein (TIGR02271 family)